jgi:hypothetical protein
MMQILKYMQRGSWTASKALLPSLEVVDIPEHHEVHNVLKWYEADDVSDSHEMWSLMCPVEAYDDRVRGKT